ncbi:MAG: hydroxymethylglutaryl-CoA lyase [Bacteroidetes bacterium]|nr:hydroxymethylglutaryl-CoA lyase [Bacteroidota bacterium]
MVRIIESPREAMQSLPYVIPTDRKVRYLNELLKVGFDTVELGSMVSPHLIPQLADTVAVIQQLDFADTRSNGMVLVVNSQGAEKVTEVDGITHLCYPFSPSAVFLKKNLNTTPEKAIQTIEDLLNIVVRRNRLLIVYLSMGFGNSYGDPWNLDILLKTISTLREMGIRQITLSNVSLEISAELVRDVYTTIIPAFTNIEFGLHLHTISASWKQKVEAAWDAGCRIFDSVIHGIGGCPMTGEELLGNLRTEYLIRFLNERKVQTSVDPVLFEKSLELASEIFN